MSEKTSSALPSEEVSERKKYAVVVGVNISSRTPYLPTLKYAESDAQGMSYLLGQKESGFLSPYPALIGRGASTQNVRETIVELIKQKNKGDLLLFYFIGHGYLVMAGDEDVDTYLVTADFDPELAEHDPYAHLSLSWLRGILFERNRTADVIVILDCCYAGFIAQSPAPEKQLVQSLRAFARSVQEKEGPQETSERFWAILTAAGANVPVYENQDHTRMTGLILGAFSGKDRNALENGGNGDLTLQSLHGYLEQRMQLLGSQYPALVGAFQRRWVLARLPASNPLKTEPKEFDDRSRLPTSAKEFFDRTICRNATFGDLNPTEIDTFFQKDRVLLQSDYVPGPERTSQMEKMGMLRHGYPSYGALLCFGQRPTTQIAGALTRCILWKDTNSSSGWYEDREYRGGLLRQFTDACEFLQTHLSEYRISSKEPVEPGTIPFRAFQEALANALIHREYASEPDRMPRAEEVKIEIFSNRVQISSPGAPPDPIDVASLKGVLEEGVSNERLGSHPRNPDIMRIFYLAGHVEKTGYGIERIQQWMEDADLRVRIRLTRTQTLVIILYLPARNPKSKDDPVNPSTQTSNPIALSMQTSAPSVTEKNKNIPVPQVGSISSPPSPSQPFYLVNSKAQTQRVLGNFFLSNWSSRIILAAVCLVLIGGAVLGLLVRNSFFIGGGQHPSTTVEIASDFPTSGDNESIGSPVQNGVAMAITEANNENLLPGYTLKLTPYNDTGNNNIHDPQKGMENIKQAIADNLVAGIIGPWNSSVAQAELPIANQASIALISPSTTYSCLTKNMAADLHCSGPYNIEPAMRPTGQLTYFRLATTNNIQGKVSADYLFMTTHYQKVVLFKDDTDAYSQSLAQAFQEEWEHLGGFVITQDLQEAVSSVQDYQNALEPLVAAQPDLIYFAGNDPNGSYALKALAAIPALKGVAFAGGGALVDTSFLLTAASLHLSAPVYISLPITDPAHSATSLGSDFQSKFIANGYRDYIPYAASAYDSTMMLIQAIKTALQQGVSTPHGAQDQAGSKQFRLAILQALAQNKYTDVTGTHNSYSGATGTHSFDSNGDTTNHTISFYQLDVTTPQPSWRWLQQTSA